MAKTLKRIKVNDPVLFLVDILSSDKNISDGDIAEAVGNIFGEDQIRMAQDKMAGIFEYGMCKAKAEAKASCQIEDIVADVKKIGNLRRMEKYREVSYSITSSQAKKLLRSEHVWSLLVSSKG